MERRVNGEGTQIKKHAKGGYYKAITLDGKRKFIYGKTKAVVAEKEKEVRKEFDEGVTGEPITLGDFMKRWLDDSVRSSVRRSTWDRYERITRVHITPELGRTKVKNLKPLQVQSLYSKKLLDQGLSPRSVQYIHRTLSKALREAVGWGYVARNVCDSVTPPKPKTKEFTPLSPDQVGILLAATDNLRDRALILMAVTTGMRQGELLGLRWGDIDLKEKVVRVRRSLSITTEGVSFVPPKSAKGKRSIGLTTSTVTVLEAHRGEEDDDEALVFGTRCGTPWAPQNLVRRSFKPLLKRAGLPDIRFHDLRHTCATLLFSRNVHPKVVQEMLGHSTISLTLDTYSHYVPSLGEKATLAMEEMVTVGEIHNDFHNIPVEHGPVEDPTGLVESSPVGRDLSF